MTFLNQALREEIQRLHALEGGLVAVFDRLDGSFCSRASAVSVIMLIEAADRHLLDLERICAEEGWPRAYQEPPMVFAWRTEVEAQVLNAPRNELSEVRGLSLLRQAVHLKIACYKSARLLSIYAERPLMTRDLRLALEDEQHSLERLRRAAELGVSLGSVVSGSPYS